MNWMKKITGFVFLMMISVASMAQVTAAKIESLTDNQIVALLKQYNLTGLTTSELEQKARLKGLSEDQIMALELRLDKIDPMLLQESSSQDKSIASSKDPYTPRTPLSTKGPRLVKKDSTLQVFGSELFDNYGLDFEGNLSMATPSNYVLGAGDELIVDVYGLSENTRKLRVSPEGNIRISNLGPVKVAGLTIDEATKKIRSSMASIYPAIRSGQTNVSVSLGQIRTIRVTLVGEIKKPGSYSLPSVATIMHAMYASGGPNAIGSYREIQLVRKGKLLVTFDLYDFLLKGDLTSNVLLQDDDVIRVPAYAKRVAVKGAVKKPAIFDAKDADDAAAIISYAGGMSDYAFKELVRVKRLGTQSRELQTVKAVDLKSFKLLSGDTLVVDSLAMRFANRVQVTGAVYYPGEYALSMFNNLSELMRHVQPKENAFLDRAIIRRLNDDLSPLMIPFNVKNVLDGKENVELKKEDSIFLFEKDRVREKYYVTIEGEVNDPSAFVYAEGMRVQDLILMAKGLRDGATLQRIEVSRRLRHKSAETDTTAYSIIHTVDIDPTNFQLSSLDLPLQPYDIVYVRRAPTYREQTNVIVEGEVMYPGKYTLQSSNERLSELINRAGGLKQNAFPKGATLVRKTFQGSTTSDSTIYEIKYGLIRNKNKDAKLLGAKAVADTSSLAQELQEVFSSQKRVAIDLEKAITEPNSSYDIVLEEGDILKIPRIQQTVQSFGEVNYPQQLAYERGMRFKSLINSSGGFTGKASRKRAYLLEANGKVRTTKHFLFIKFYPRVSPGSEAYVPVKRVREPLSKGETIAITTGLVSLAGVLLTIIKTL
jgi:protein involved in polysaccharide export with SLBB domain